MTRLVAAFLDQANHCEHLGSAFMARLLRLVAQHWPIEGALAQRLEAWPGDIGPKGASLPLRLASALHALVLNGQSAQLRTVYPPYLPFFKLELMAFVCLYSLFLWNIHLFKFH